LEMTIPLQQRVLALTNEVASLRAQIVEQEERFGSAAAAANNAGTASPVAGMASPMSDASASFPFAAARRTGRSAGAAGFLGLGERHGAVAAAAAAPSASSSPRSVAHKRKAGKALEAAAKKQRADALRVGELLEGRRCNACGESEQVTPGVFQPCGHLAACLRCAVAWQQTNDRCPHCKEEVTQVQRIHFP